MSGILLVHAKGGPAASYAVAKVAAVAPVHVLAVTPLPSTAVAEVRLRAASLVDASQERLHPQNLVDRVVQTAQQVSAEGIVTFSEFAVVAVAQACERLGLRSAGPGVVASRDKLVMRSVWEAAGVPGPPFRAVNSLEDLYAAWESLPPPVLLKAAWSAGSIAQMVVTSRADIPAVWDAARSALGAAVQSGAMELSTGRSHERFLAEQVICSTTESWYDVPGYGDYLSVEGLVVDGTYHPVCITSRLPTIRPFTELSNQAPCVLAEPLQREIERAARRAVDALGLGTCGTHTELKLQPDRKLCLLESAARLGGAMVAREVEVVYGVDLIGGLTRALLGENPGLPDRMQVERSRRAAASVALLATDSSGRPWRTLPVFDPSRIDWSTLISPDSQAEVVSDLSIAAGSPMPRYDPARGVLNFAGLLFIEAPDPETLLADTYHLLDGLEHSLSAPDA